MYPNLYYAFEDLFGVKIKGLQLINSFGFFVAIAFLIGAWVLTKELKRKESEGLFQYTERTVTSNQQTSWFDVLLNFVLGFFLGYKIIGAFLISEALDDPQAFIFSAKGNLIAGLLVAAFFGGMKFRERQKTASGKPEKRILRIWPHDRVGDIVIYAAVFGFAGAKLFDILENPAAFARSFNAWRAGTQDAASFLFSGLTIYGGLILATIAIIFYARKHKINVLHFADAFATTMMIAYALGRIGCQVAGDGDWGVPNAAYISTPDAKIVAATPDQANAALYMNSNFYLQELHIDSLQQAKHPAVKAFAGLPDWLFAYNYPHNVVDAGSKIQGCNGRYCSQLPIPAFPTPFYEILMCTVLFCVLWALRKRIKIAGRLAAIYLVMNGLERFLIEKIRVNVPYEIYGFHPTQAEIISVLLMIAGVILYIMAPKMQPDPITKN
jgi:phosphatidylglycerol---prolipoprotein diacylglyceryl transferase